MSNRTDEEAHMAEGFLFSDMLRARCKAEDGGPAMVYCGREYSFAQLLAAAELCAGDLVKGGVRPGDHVALLSVNCANWLVALFGIIRAGGVAVLANYSAPDSELAELLAFADVKYVACGDTPRSAEDEQARQRLLQKLSIDGPHLYDIREARMDYLKRVCAGELPQELPEENADSRRTAIIVFTSGTTGAPKAVQQSQFAVISNVRQSLRRGEGLLNKSLLLALPLFHSYGLAIAMSYLCAGATVYIPNKLTPNALVEAFAEYGIPDIFSVGILYEGVMAHPRFEKEVAPRVRICGIGGGFSTPEQMERFASAFPKACFYSGYGQTEACTVIAAPCPGDPAEVWAYTVGKPLDGIKTEIRSQAGSALPDGEIGEIVIRSDSLMNGYYKLPEEQQPVDADGWLHTGDLGYFNASGNLCLTGRIKDIIIKDGENISAAEVESAILDCGGVREACVLSVQHPVWGESIEACIIPAEGCGIDEASLRARLRSRLSAFKTPEHFFVYTQFPLGVSGKVDRRALRVDVQRRLGGPEPARASRPE